MSNGTGPPAISPQPHPPDKRGSQLPDLTGIGAISQPLPPQLNGVEDPQDRGASPFAEASAQPDLRTQDAEAFASSTVPQQVPPVIARNLSRLRDSSLRALSLLRGTETTRQESELKPLAAPDSTGSVAIDPGPVDAPVAPTVSETRRPAAWPFGMRDADAARDQPESNVSESPSRQRTSPESSARDFASHLPDSSRRPIALGPFAGSGAGLAGSLGLRFVPNAVQRPGVTATLSRANEIAHGPGP